jgi:hypothetical protein
MIRRLSALALVALALTCACSDQTEKDVKARWAAAYTLQCNKAVASNASVAQYGSRFCACVAEKTVRTFSAVQLPLMLISKPLKDAAKELTSECALIASMQEEYNRLMAALRANNDLAVTAYLAPDFIGTDVRGRHENTRQMLFRIDSRRHSGFEMTAVLSARTSGKRIIVDRKSLESTETIAGGKRRAVETLSFFSDTWIDSDGAWLLQRSRTDRIDTYVDGRRVSQLKSPSALAAP